MCIVIIEISLGVLHIRRLRALDFQLLGFIWFCRCDQAKVLPYDAVVSIHVEFR